MHPGTYAVVLAVDGEAALRAVAVKLARAGIPHVACFEPDAPWCGQMTAVGLKPVEDRAAVRRVLSSLPLFGKREVAAA